MYLPDTNIFILGLKGNDPEAKFLSKAISSSKLAISIIVMAEFLAKAEGQGESSFRKLLAKFGILPINEETAEVAAEYRKMSSKTKRIHLLDCFLAAQAKINKLTLVTNDRSDFPMRDIKVVTP